MRLSNDVVIVSSHPLDRFLASYIDKIESGSNGYYNGIFGKPEWPQFVKLMLMKPADRWDENWAPITSLCPPCMRWKSLTNNISDKRHWHHLKDFPQVHGSRSHGNIFRRHLVYHSQVDALITFFVQNIQFYT